VIIKKFRTNAEEQVAKKIESIFMKCPDSIEEKMENFPKYVRRQHLKRFLAMYEIFKLVLPVKGSIVECGVFKGFGVMTWAKLSAMLEPENLTRRVYGFDTFSGFPCVSSKDDNAIMKHEHGEFFSGSYEELLELITEYDKDRFLGHIEKVRLIKGNVDETIPKFISNNQHLLISLLFLDMDLFEPTKVALDYFLPRMPKGAILAFDELDNPMWPGETLALMEHSNLNHLRLQRLEWDPYITYLVIE
jgi:hypothetical protein